MPTYHRKVKFAPSGIQVQNSLSKPYWCRWKNPPLISSGYGLHPKMSSYMWSVTWERTKAHLQYKQEKEGTWDFRTSTALLWIHRVNLGNLLLLCVCSSNLPTRWWLCSVPAPSNRFVFISFRKTMYSHWACITVWLTMENVDFYFGKYLNITPRSFYQILSLDGIQTGKSNYTGKKNSGLLLNIPWKTPQNPETNRLR